MLALLEHHAKQLLAQAGFPVPPGLVATDAQAALGAATRIPGPWMVKAQVPVKARAALGGVRRAGSPADVGRCAEEMLDATFGGARCRAVLVEALSPPSEEWYVAAGLDPDGRCLQALCSASGGSGVEERLAAGAPPPVEFLPDRPPSAADLRRRWGVPADVCAAAERLCRFAVARDALLAEINPLARVAGGDLAVLDAHVSIDEAAAFRQPCLAEFEPELAAAHPAFAWRRRWGGDFQTVDPDGRVAVVNTGAGAGMLLMDELARRGVPCFNFADIRTGGMLRHPERLDAAVDAILAGTGVRSVLVNFHAGITDLATLLPVMTSACRRLRASGRRVVVRLAGRNAEQALAAMAADGFDATSSLDEAVARVCR